MPATHFKFLQEKKSEHKVPSGTLAGIVSQMKN